MSLTQSLLRAIQLLSDGESSFTGMIKTLIPGTDVNVFKPLEPLLWEAYRVKFDAQDCEAS